MMSRLRLPVVVLMLVVAACATAAEDAAEVTESTMNATTTAPPESTTASSTSPTEAIEPVGDALVQHDDDHTNETGENETHAGDEQPTQVTQEPAPTSEPEPAPERLPSIEAYSRVKWDDTEALPEWPFEGLVQLAWTGATWREDGRWQLRFYQWTDSGVGRGWTVGEIPLPDLSIACVGDVGLISHGPDGLEVGGPAGSVSPSYFVPWGGVPERLDAPSGELLAEIGSRPSNVDADVSGDIVSIGHGDASVRFALREPARSEGDWWNIQARHDGDVFVVTVHPGNHPCFSGVTWMSAAASGEMLACGTNTAATKFIASDTEATGPLVLPDAGDFRTVLSCPYPLSHRTLRYGQPR